MPRGVTRRVALVDNRTVIRQGVRAALERYGDVVVVGESGVDEGVVERVRATNPDVVLVGVHRGGADLLEVIANIHDGGNHGEVILLAGDGVDPELIFGALRAGVRGIVSQDSGIDELVKAIHLVASGQVVVSSHSLTSLVDTIAQPRSAGDQAPVTQLLSTREWEVLDLVVEGATNREIARRLFVSESTVRSHIHNILSKLHLSNRVQAAAYALEMREKARSPRGT